MNGLPIETENLYIQELILEDSKSFFDLMNQPEVQEFIPDRFESIEELEGCINWLISNYSKDIENIIRITFSIKSKENSKLLGWVSYGPLPSNEDLKEIAYVIHPQYWGNGYATSSLKAFINWLNYELKVNTVYAEVDCLNNRSINVLEKNRFSRLRLFTDDKGHYKYLYNKDLTE
ncbi:MAG: GNAT family N-acetyltransferase [Ruminiclostridium sp.]|nr:GNAT family N-acetyltransferase [Ruminiclostridium sp.]